MTQLNMASRVSDIYAPIFGAKLEYAVRLVLEHLWELYEILMCQACWMVHATAVHVHNVYLIVIDFFHCTYFLL